MSTIQPETSMSDRLHEERAVAVEPLVDGTAVAPGEAAEDFLQLLTPDGRRVANPDFDPFVADLDAASLVRLYEDHVVVRRIDTEAMHLQRQGELGLWAPLLGQEAAQIGSARSLREDDFVFSSYRENAVAYCRGVDLTDLMRVWRGNSHSGWDPFEINMAIPSVIIGTQALHATGYALGCQYDGSDQIAIAYFGDGATSQGDVSEAMVFAARFQAPVIFFCQNNQWAISEPVERQARIAIANRAPGFGIPSIRVDGNDVLAVMAATSLAVERARTGGGPTFIEAVTYRMGPHTTSDDPTRYRSKDELDSWSKKDPITRLEAHLDGMGALTEQVREQVQAKADTVAAAVRSGTLGLTDPAVLSVFDHVLSTPSSWLERQKSQYVAYLDMFEGGAR